MCMSPYRSTSKIVATVFPIVVEKNSHPLQTQTPTLGRHTGPQSAPVRAKGGPHLCRQILKFNEHFHSIVRQKCTTAVFLGDRVKTSGSLQQEIRWHLDSLGNPFECRPYEDLQASRQKPMVRKMAKAKERRQRISSQIPLFLDRQAFGNIPQDY